MKSATHSGHCQCCGRLQKLPLDVLSKHGYTVDHGYFCGTCRGSGEKPYELSCGLIKSFIMDAKRHLALLEITQANLRKPVTEPKAWIHEYIPATWQRRHSSYQWREVEVAKTVNQLSDGYEYVTFYYMGRTINANEGKCKIDSLPFATKDLLEVCRMLNSRKADWMESDIRQMQSYIKWQQKRVDQWTERPLLPIEHKDKEGFELVAR